MAHSCLSTARTAALRLPCPRPHSDSASVFLRAPSRHHGHWLIAYYIAAPAVAVARRSRRVTAMAAQEEGAATAVEEAQEEDVQEPAGQAQEAEPAGEFAEEQGAAAEASSDDASNGATGAAEAEAEAASTKLYFGNLPYNCDSAQLAGIVQDHAVPEMVEVLYDRTTGRSRGFAFVTMSTLEDCERVIKNLDGSMYSGRTMRVNMADRPKPKLPLYQKGTTHTAAAEPHLLAIVATQGNWPSGGGASRRQDLLRCTAPLFSPAAIAATAPISVVRFLDLARKILMYQLCKGVVVCHGRGVLHGDLKPHNLLLDRKTMALKIADLGLSHAFTVSLNKYTHERLGDGDYGSLHQEFDGCLYSVLFSFSIQRCRALQLLLHWIIPTRMKRNCNLHSPSNCPVCSLHFPSFLILKCMSHKSSGNEKENQIILNADLQLRFCLRKSGWL